MSLPNAGDQYAGRFLIERLLGQGGFAAVYLASDAATGLRVALKVLQPDHVDGFRPDTRARFSREIDLVRRLNHPNIVQLIDASTDATNSLWAAFEYIPGEDLTDLMRRRGQMPVQEVEFLLRQALSGLGAAHNSGLLHRDIKPANLRISRRPDGSELLKVLDFGIARSSDSGHPSVTKTGELIGTPRYMSPEQLRGVPLTPASDLYSLALVAYEMLYGEDALGGGSLLDQMNRVLPGFEFSWPMHADHPIRRVLEAMLQQDAAIRISSAREALSALDGGPIRQASGLLTIPPRQQLPGRRPIPTGPVHAESPAAAPPTPLSPALIGGLAIVVALLAAIGVVAALGGSKAPPPAPEVKTAPNNVGKLLKSKPSQPTQPKEPPVVVPQPSEPAEDGLLIGGEAEYKGRGLRRPDGQFAYYPSELDHQKKYPAIFIFQDKNETWWDFVQQSGWQSVADENDVILLGSSDRGDWRGRDVSEGRTESSYDLAIPRLRGLLEDLPVDSDRIYAVAHATGVRVVPPFSKEPFVKALTIHSFNRKAGTSDMTSDRPVPILFIAPTNSEAWHLGDGRCNPSLDKIENLEEELRVRNGSSGKVQTRTIPIPETGEEAVCRTWNGDAPLEICHVPGGYRWPGTGPFVENDCFGVGIFDAEKEARFPSTLHAWGFFKRVSGR